MWNLNVYSEVKKLQQRLSFLSENKTVGFVPTMGALHQGHLSLVKKAQAECDVVVVSVFVNPTQFDNSEDLEKYPRTLQKDVELLNTLGDIIVFAPTEKEIYPADFNEIHLDLGKLETVMEGAFRPGHFNGVVNVVKRLFDIVQPTKAFFGWKDFQQVAVIKFMVKTLQLPIEIVGCEIYRESSGLASSSRNTRLTETQKEDALILIQSLQKAKSLAEKKSVEKIIDIISADIKNSPLTLEYFAIVDPETLQPIKDWTAGARGCLAAYCGEVRLIDNLELIPSKK